MLFKQSLARAREKQDLESIKRQLKAWPNNYAIWKVCVCPTIHTNNMYSDIPVGAINASLMVVLDEESVDYYD